MTTVLNILYNHFHEDIENHMRETAKLSIMDEEFAQSLENDPVHKLILDPIVPDTLKQILILHVVYTSKYNPLLLQYGICNCCNNAFNRADIKHGTCYASFLNFNGKG